MKHIVPLICERLADHIIRRMQTNIPEGDLVRANTVKVGRFQANPLETKVYISVQGGDAEKPELRDGIVSLDVFDKVAWDVPPREIGGGTMWWRQGTCQFGCYFQGETEDEARQQAYAVLGRLSDCIDTVVVSDLIDDFGELASKMLLTSTEMFEGGGPDNYVWRGKVHWMCLTNRSI